MTKSFRLGSGSGFWGDALDPALELVEHANLDYLCSDYLAELTMALLQRQKLKTPDAGYIPDVVSHVKALLGPARANGTTLISNGGGANPRAAARALVETARELDMPGTRIALIEGDDLLDRLDELDEAGVGFTNMETGDADFERVRNRVVAANVYTDSSGIVEALAADADIVVAGRVSDNALFVGPILFEQGWDRTPENADRIGAAITLGHIMECAAACTGGMSSRWAEMPHMGRAGFPIIELEADGSAVITKLAHTGGRVDPFTIKEHLVYEIGDPANYVMPDGIADFTTLSLEDLGDDRVRITNMSGRSPPDHLKLVIGYQDGWVGEGQLFFPWPDALGRAAKARESLLERFERMGLQPDAMQFDLIGVNCLHGPAAPEPPADLNEVGLRVAVRAATREEAEKVRRACSQLWIMGPGGTAFGTPLKSRPVVSLWPTLVPRELMRQSVEILEA